MGNFKYVLCFQWTFVLWLFVGSVCFAAQQEETFTDLVPGVGMLDPKGLEILIEKGDVRAINNMGLLWAKGYEGNQSYEEAIRWWQEAAKQGYTVSMNNIGLLYANGHGVDRDMNKAFEWWLQAAFLGNAWAMNSVGDCYETGEGVQRDYQLSMTWYKSAAKEGDSLAMYNVGSLFDRGLGVEANAGEAMTWYRDAAERGEGSASVGIGYLFKKGRGVQSDIIEAYAWFLVASEMKHSLSESEIRKLDAEVLEIKEGLNDEQLKLAIARYHRVLRIVTPTKPQRSSPNDSKI